MSSSNDDRPKRERGRCHAPVFVMTAVRPAGARHEARRLVEQGIDPPDDLP